MSAPRTGPVAAVLVANRGEIAVRVIAAATARGIRAVAVAPADDADCAHVRAAPERVELPGVGAAAYLDAEAVVAAALATGCDAVHPGYGFLSENAAFAARCTAAGLRFVGPDAAVLELLGDKSRARDHARSLGVPLVAGTDGPTTLEQATAFLGSLGPGGAVMVKALAGGGGRGMRPVLDAAELPAAWERATSEAERAFGDGTLYVEQLLPGARHVEVQLVGDGTGAVTALGDRDCSLQRRRQKLVEIAPAPHLAPELRAALSAAAVTIGASLDYRGLATVEFLVRGAEWVFLEVNPRVQVEHTVTEEVTGVDLVETALLVAGGSTLAELGLSTPPPSRGTALQARVNTEVVRPDGAVTAAVGVLTRFDPPAGRGVRVDTHGWAGYAVSPRYDSLLAKVVVSDPRGDVASVAVRAGHALAGFRVDGVATTLGLLRALLERPELATAAFSTTFVEDHLAELLDAAPADLVPPPAGAAPPPEAAPADPVVAEGETASRTVQAGVVVRVLVAAGDPVAAGETLAVVEAMKMESVVAAPVGGVVRAVLVAAGDVVGPGALVATVAEDEQAAAASTEADPVDLDHERPDLAEVVRRHRTGLDEARPAAVARRHAAGRWTAREGVAALVDPGSLTEYGALTIAAQRQRRTVADLVERTPADGVVTGTATVEGRPVAVMAYDYTVLAGTQGIQSHRKTDRLLELAARQRLPLVVFAEGGGGRPGDTDTTAVAQLDVPTFRLAAALSGTVPTVAVVSGWCFAGNAALAGACDVIIATAGSSLAMGGPAMIEGGGLGVVAPADVGPMDVQVANGVVDVLVADDAAAVDTARRYLGYVTHPTTTWRAADQRTLRSAVPENRLRTYDVRRVVETLADTGSILELRREFGVGIVTALGRVEGRAVGIMANSSEHLGGAIDGDAADKATRFLQLCQAHGLPVVSLCDTPGFMVGPDAERTGTVRRFSAMFTAGARLTVPLCAVVLRKGYGLGAMAMAGGDLKAPAVTVSWPTGEFGGMGLEGGVRLGYRAELDAIADPDARRARYDELVAAAYERGGGLSTAAAFEIDDVIDPASTRDVLSRVLSTATR